MNKTFSSLHIASRQSSGSLARSGRGFSLVEVLVAVALIGVLVFIALPNIVQIKDDSETHLAIARAEALNMGMASLVQARGSASANSAWTAAATDEGRYSLITPYLAFAPTNLASYTPGGYGLTFQTPLIPLKKTILTKGGSEISY